MPAVRHLSLATLALVTAFALTGCGLLFASPGDGPSSTIAPIILEEDAELRPVSGGDQFPDVLEVQLRPQSDGTYDVAVTLSSPYDTAQRYADGWRVLDPDGNTLGTHTLLHDHASEQPFTRTQTGLAIPAGVTEVTIEGRDQSNGFGGLTLTVPVPDV